VTANTKTWKDKPMTPSLPLQLPSGFPQNRTPGSPLPVELSQAPGLLPRTLAQRADSQGEAVPPAIASRYSAMSAALAVSV